MGEKITKKNRIQLSILVILILLCSIIIVTKVKAQPPTLVKGDVYIDGTITEPDGVSLILSDKIMFASIYDGQYRIIFESLEEEVTGTFTVDYQGTEYTPPETVNITEGEYMYIIDLHVATDGGGQPEDPTNLQPIANADGPYYKAVNSVVNFDGSDSYDPDGTILSYVWDFGDGTTSNQESPAHTYTTVRNYQVTLTVIDDKGAIDTDITYAYITETENNPPTKPVVNGETIGETNTLYNYTIYSTDIENDTIQYVFDWGDETDITSSHFLENGTIYTTNHTWEYAGIYTLTAYALDENDAVSEPTEIKVLIDSIYLENIGYMIDFTNDGYYDFFHSNTTGEETTVDFVDDLYLIDDDNDGNYDYQYNTTNSEVSEYIAPINTPERTPTLLDMINEYIVYIFIAVLIITILTTLILIYKIRRMPKKKSKKAKKKKSKKPAKAEKEKKAPESKEKTIDDRITDIEKKIDELLSNKK